MLDIWLTLPDFVKDVTITFATDAKTPGIIVLNVMTVTTSINDIRVFLEIKL